MKINLNIILILSITTLHGSVAFPGAVNVNTEVGIKQMKLVGDEHFYWYEKEDGFYRYNKTTKEYSPIMVTETGDLDSLERAANINNVTGKNILKKATKKDLYKIWAKKRQKNHAIIK
jgi:hypothetical protein